MKLLPLIAVGFCMIANCGLAQSPKPDDLLTAHLRTRLLTETKDKMTGEGVAWHAAFGATRFLEYAKETGDAAYIGAAVTYFDALLDATFESPDGYRGWVGPYIYERSKIGDVHVSDAILVNPMLAVAEYVLQQGPRELREKYGDAARRYVDYARVHVIEKWLERDTWWDDGVYGGFFSWDHYLSRDKSRWVREESVKNSSLGLPFNKNMDVGVTLLRLYRLTGNPDYRARAKMIFDSFKSRLSLFKDSYAWNYWEPVFPHDVRGVAPEALAHWVGTHPYRNYQAGEMECVAEAYHMGVTFTREDMERFVSTNLMMWNGSFEDAQFVNSDHAANLSLDPDYEQPEPHSTWGGPAGAAWGALAQFDGTIARLTGHDAPEEDPYERHFLAPVDVLEFPHDSNRAFMMGFAMPSVIQEGEAALIACKMREAGEVQVLLVSEDGSEVVAEIAQGDVQLDDSPSSGLQIVEWTPDVGAGKYRIRWKTGAEYRDFPVEVKRQE